MLTPETYTDQQAADILRSHADALDDAVHTLENFEGDGPGTMAPLRECALAVATDLWKFEGLSRDGDVWNGHPGLWSAPVLALEVEALADDPGRMFTDEDGDVGPYWHFIRGETERLSGDLMEWVEAHGGVVS